ncbi:hypothetical protein [Dictyobacter alpinus]|nr:hypothetical protein [Dictyobacter alpinus]
MEQDWWVREGYYPFSAGSDDDAGYPHPGQVIKYYRTQKQWKRSDGKIGRCRQKDIAGALGITESRVRAMENTGDGLNSVARRRLLIELLGIPPVLLGLSMIPDVEKATNLGATTRQLDMSTIRWYQSSLGDSWELYYTGAAPNLPENLANKIGHLRNIVPQVTSQQKTLLLALQCRFYFLAARVASDQNDQLRATSFLLSSKKIANQLNDPDLIASTHFWHGRMLLENNKFAQARTELSKAMQYAPQLQSLQLRGGIYLEAGLAHAYTAQTASEKKFTLTLFDEANSVLKKSNGKQIDDSYIKVNAGRYHQFRAEALIALKQPESALQELEYAEQHTSPDLTRRRTYIEILKAKAAVDQKDYIFASYTLREALKNCRSIKSDVNISFIKEIVTDLSQTPYAKSIEVVSLRKELGL